MQIKINLKIFLFIIIFILTHQIEVYGWIMLFAFVHELGHMFSGIILKLKPKSLSFMPFGISITFEIYEYKKLIELKKILIAIAGPLTNIIISIIMLIIHIDNRTEELILYSNILIALFNLIPIYPLDGGRILKGIIRLNKNEKETDKFINTISNILIILLTATVSIIILYLKNISILFVTIYLWVIVFKENRRYHIKMKIYEMLEKDKEYIDI